MKNQNIFNEFEALNQTELESVFGGESAWYWISYHVSAIFHPAPATWSNPTAGELMSA
jgi:hypothetical protein